MKYLFTTALACLLALAAGNIKAMPTGNKAKPVTSTENEISVNAATTKPIVLSGMQTVDGVVLLEGNRVLVKDQTDATKNGIYRVSPGAWVRAEEADQAGEIENVKVTVSAGAENKNTLWACKPGKIVLGSTFIMFVKIIENPIDPFTGEIDAQ